MPKNKNTASKKPFYITTTLPYVNSDPHIGFAAELIRADIIARYKKLMGYEVLFNTGTDEHGVKIHRKAQEQGKDTQTYVDEYAAKFKALIPLLGITSDIKFVRTTDAHHIMAAQEFWKLADKNGLIYKKNYSVKYCIGCELEKTDSELTDGRCPLHPLQEIENIQEENYFFRFSVYGKSLMDIYEKRSDFVLPQSRLNEIRAFVERGLEDFSISRLASKMPWGIPVPGDEAHVIYVWFDALINYVSTIGWPDDMESFNKWWIESGGVVQYCGKDNLRQQSAMWQAMLLAAKIPPSKNIIVCGFITGDGGVKMSKSLGNTVDPQDLVKEFGAEALRYYVARELSVFEDSPFTALKFKEAYNAHLANGLGNLTSRVLKMAVDNGINADWKNIYEEEKEAMINGTGSYEKFVKAFESFKINEAANEIWARIQRADKRIQDEQPFKVVKIDREKGCTIITELAVELYRIACMLEPILPTTSSTIRDLLESKTMPSSPLFMRK